MRAYAANQVARSRSPIPIEGDPARLRVPPPRPPRIGAWIWQHTCCECFIAVKVSPVTIVQLRAFRRVVRLCVCEVSRRRSARGRGVATKFAVRSHAGRLELDASIPLERLSALHPHAVLRLRCRRWRRRTRRAFVVGAQACARQTGFPSSGFVRAGSQESVKRLAADNAMKIENRKQIMRLVLSASIDVHRRCLDVSLFCVAL